MDHALDLLTAFDEQRLELSVAEIARRIGTHRSTASRLAALLHQRGFLQRVGQLYRPGVELVRLGALAVDGIDLVAHLRPAMEMLSSRTGETVDLGVADGDAVLTVAEIRSTHLLSYAGWAGRRSPAHSASSGKVLLAFGALAPRFPLARHTGQTITDPGTLARELGEVRRRGWAFVAEEQEAGLMAMAAPVFDDGGKCVAALSVAAPSQRMDCSVGERYASWCRTAIQESGPVRAAHLQRAGDRRLRRDLDERRTARP